MQSYQRHHTFAAFSENDLDRVLEGRLAKMSQEIRDEADSYLLNVNRDDYVSHMASRFNLGSLIVHADQVSLTHEEMLIPSEFFPRHVDARAGNSYPRLVLTFHVPFEGDADLLKCQPNPYGSVVPHIWIDGQTACFEIIDLRQDAEEIKRRAEETNSALRNISAQINAQLAPYNAGLRGRAEQLFDQRKAQLLERRNYLQALNVPIRSTQQTAQTYAAPMPKKIVPINPRPAVVDKDYRPDPTMDDRTYHEVVALILNSSVETSIQSGKATYPIHLMGDDSVVRK